jgi:hypothetical protein
MHRIVNTALKAASARCMFAPIPEISVPFASPGIPFGNSFYAELSYLSFYLFVPDVPVLCQHVASWSSSTTAPYQHRDRGWYGFDDECLRWHSSAMR